MSTAKQDSTASAQSADSIEDRTQLPRSSATSAASRPAPDGPIHPASSCRLQTMIGQRSERHHRLVSMVRRSDSRSGLAPGASARAGGQHGRRRFAPSTLSPAPMPVRHDPGQGKVAPAADGSWGERRGLVPDGAACRSLRDEREPDRQRRARRGPGSRWA